jgi:hypothetical protein
MGGRACTGPGRERVNGRQKPCAAGVVDQGHWARSGWLLRRHREWDLRRRVAVNRGERGRCARDCGRHAAEADGLGRVAPRVHG